MLKRGMLKRGMLKPGNAETATPVNPQVIFNLHPLEVVFRYRDPHVARFNIAPVRCHADTTKLQS